MCIAAKKKLKRYFDVDSHMIIISWRSIESSETSYVIVSSLRACVCMLSYRSSPWISIQMYDRTTTCGKNPCADENGTAHSTISNDNDRRNCNSLLRCATSRGLQRVHTRVTQSDWPSASGKLVLHNSNIIVLYLFRVNKYIKSIVKYYKMYEFHYLILLN